MKVYLSDRRRGKTFVLNRYYSEKEMRDIEEVINSLEEFNLGYNPELRPTACASAVSKALLFILLG